MTDHEIIERFKETVDYLLDKSYSDFLARDHYERAADVLLMLERQEPGWISVNDMMPPNDDTKVLTYGDPVTHWMLLPEPPKEEEK